MLSARSVWIGWMALAVAALASSSAAQAGAQQRPSAPIPYRVMGQVVVPRADTMLPVAGVWVTLHRVGKDSAGPIDSSRVGTDGRFAFRYERWGDPDAVYFLSGTYGGIAYFSEPLRSAFVQGDAAQILVYDTTSSTAGVRVQGRHLLVSSQRDGRRHEVIEVYELSNDSAQTVVSPDSARPVWSTSIPAEAQEFQVSRGDVGAEAVTLRNGRVSLFAPISPGIRQLSFSYFLPASSFPLEVPMRRRAEVLEVLVEDPAARVSGAGLAEEEPVTLESRQFKRFLAQTVDSTAVIEVTLGEQRASRAFMLTIVASLTGLLMLVALARAFWRRRTPDNLPQPVSAAQVAETATGPRLATAASPAVRGPEPASQSLVREIAALDAAFEQRVPAADAEETSAYERRRETLKRELASALARERQQA